MMPDRVVYFDADDVYEDCVYQRANGDGRHNVMSDDESAWVGERGGGGGVVTRCVDVAASPHQSSSGRPQTASVCSGVLSNPHHPLLHSHITSSLTVPHTISDCTTPTIYYMEFIQMFNSK